ncbi:MAG: DUF2313 domain-containing protein [Lachnospiraceae bacterium]|nr:DUF2313 domain-containing protein [Lachnospiraceae bacterium]
MIREVDLVSYLPQFLRDYKELDATLEAEDPEFVLVWRAADRTLQNEFIESADEYGIARFEKIMKILPSTEDTIESRRARVKSKWFSMIPYTLKMLITKLIALCGNTDFTIKKEYEDYRIEIMTHLGLFGQVEELERIMKDMTPCNMVVVLENQVICRSAGTALAMGNVCCIEQSMITNDFNRQIRVSATGSVGAGTVISETFEMEQKNEGGKV